MKEFIEVSRAATCASVVILESCSPESVVAKRRDSVTLRAANSSGMTDKQCDFCRCFSVVYFKGVVSFFFVKILKIRAEYTWMYLPYKNAYKRLFCPNIKVLTRRKNERVY